MVTQYARTTWKPMTILARDSTSGISRKRADGQARQMYKKAIELDPRMPWRMDLGWTS